MLVSLNPDRTDCSGNSYPDSGYVEAKDYKPNDNLLQGLYGIAWGQYRSTQWLNLSQEAQWCIVRTERNSELLPLDKHESLTKFRNGLVVFSGSREECEEYAAKQRPTDAGAFGRLWTDLATERNFMADSQSPETC